MLQQLDDLCIYHWLFVFQYSQYQYPINRETGYSNVLGDPGTCGAATAMAATPKIQLQLGHSLDPLFNCNPFDSKWTKQQI